ncbi:MAG TPA: hypothetical protein VKY36_06175 [Moheibacter sp.]|nr:hypothetical protein [Moheibacter sp.]
MKMLLSIRNFEEGFINHSENVQRYVTELIRNYERASDYLKQNATAELGAEREDLLNEIHVYGNQVIQHLKMVGEVLYESGNVNPASWKEFETQKTYLFESALKFERLGQRVLSDERLRHWEADFVILENSILPSIENELNTARFIIDFVGKYNREDREKFLGIIKETKNSEVDWADPKESEAHYIKVIKQFKEEFEPKTNLWDSIMELLAGDVHPSPSERIMFEKWIDGEQKEREDM